MLAQIHKKSYLQIIKIKSFYSSKNQANKSSVYRRQLAKHLIPLNSVEGKRIFQQSLKEKNCQSFFTLIQHFNSQNQISTCASATLSMILNSLKIDPGRNWKGIWRWYDDYNIKQMPESKLREGLTLEQFHNLAIKNGAKSMVFSPLIAPQSKPNHILRNSSLSFFRNCLISCHRRTNMLMTINFSRKSLSQTGSGHFSPLAAYNSKKDMALILDVAKFKYDSYWCSVEQIYKSLKQIDPISKQSRGFSINKKNYTIQQNPESSLCALEYDPQLNQILPKQFQHIKEHNSLQDFFTHLLNQNRIHILFIPILYEFYTAQIQNKQYILAKIASESLFDNFSQSQIMGKLNNQSKLMIQAFTKEKIQDTFRFLALVLFSNLQNKKFLKDNFNSQQYQQVKLRKLLIKCQRSLQTNHQNFSKS